MKVLNITTFTSGGAGSAALLFHQLLLDNDVTSQIICYKGKNDCNKGIQVYKPSIIEYLWFNFFRVYDGIRRKYISKSEKNHYFSGRFQRFSKINTARLIKHLPFIPDIIVVHSIPYFLNEKNIYELNSLTNAPIIWRFNDMVAFTGGCHYTLGCNNYKNLCGNCPALNSKKIDDISYKNTLFKQKYLSVTNLTFVSSTSEIDEEVKSSSIGKDSLIQKILLGLDYNVEHVDENEARKKLQLPNGKKIIACVAHKFSDKRKGFEEIKEILNTLCKIVSEEIRKDILIVFVSNDNKLPTNNIPFPLIKLGLLEKQQLAYLYQSATVFLSASIQDGGPFTICESALNGTPVVAFNVGLAKDLIQHKENGYIIPKFDTNLFAERLNEILSLSNIDLLHFKRRTQVITKTLLSPNREFKEFELLFSKLRKNND